MCIVSIYDMCCGRFRTRDRDSEVVRIFVLSLFVPLAPSPSWSTEKQWCATGLLSAMTCFSSAVSIEECLVLVCLEVAFSSLKSAREGVCVCVFVFVFVCVWLGVCASSVCVCE